MQIQKENMDGVDRIASTDEFILRAVNWFKHNKMDATIRDVQLKLASIGLFNLHYVNTGYADLARTIRKLEKWGLLESKKSVLPGTVGEIKHKVLFCTPDGERALAGIDKLKGLL